eukprot:162567_1
MSSKSSSTPTVLIYIKCMGGGATGRKTPLDIPIGSTVGDLKQYTRCLHPTTIVNRILFSGKMLQKDDTKQLSDFGVYKECTVQLMLKKAQSPSDIMDASTIKMIRERRLKRQHTEEDIQFGDAIIIRLIEARNLMEISSITNTYCVLRYDNQIQRGSVVKNNKNPSFNETFGFYVEMQIGKPKSDYIQIGIYHHDNNKSNKPKSYGSFQLKVQDLPRNKQIDHFCKLDSGTGEVFCSIRRAPIVSPDLAITMKKIIALTTPWTKQMLATHKVSLYHFLGSQPWQLTDETHKSANSVLNMLLDSVNSNKINLQNYRNVNKVTTMLRSQRGIITSDTACPTLYFSDMAATEKDLFDYLCKIVPNGVKSIYYNIPKVTMQDIQSSMDNIPNIYRQSYIIIQFKNTSTAIRALLNILCNSDEKFDCFISFGPPKECDNSGVIGASSRSFIEGFLQVNVPKHILEIYNSANHGNRNEQKSDGPDGGGGGGDEKSQWKNNNDNQSEIGEAFYVND